MDNLLDILFGNEPGVAYLAAQIFGILGFIAMALIDFLNREEKESKFSFKYWVRNNWQSSFAFIVLLTIAMFVGLRFQTDIVEGIQSKPYGLEFVKDKWFLFFIGGLLFRGIVFQANKLYKKLTK